MIRKTFEFIGEIVGYWLWLALFWGFLALIGLGLNTELGWAIMIIFTIALLIKIAYGMIVPEKTDTYDKTK